MICINLLNIRLSRDLFPVLIVGFPEERIGARFGVLSSILTVLTAVLAAVLTADPLAGCRLKAAAVSLRPSQPPRANLGFSFQFGDGLIDLARK